MLCGEHSFMMSEWKKPGSITAWVWAVAWACA